MKTYFLLTSCFSGRPSCLCSKVEECENNGDNELDFIMNIIKVTPFVTSIEYLFFVTRKKTVKASVLSILTVLTTHGNIIIIRLPSINLINTSGTTAPRRSLATFVCCCLTALRETPPAPPVTQLQCPAVFRLDQPRHQPRHQPLPFPPAHQLLLKVASKKNASSSQNILALIISGGKPTTASSSVEVYVPSTGQRCLVPDMPDTRNRHSMEQMTVCGGQGAPSTCLSLTDGLWERTTTLRTQRCITYM